MLIEDDPVFRQVLTRTFSRRELVVHEAADGDSATQINNRHQPDYSVLDLKLASESGLGLISPLLECNPDLRILLLTGYASIPTAVQAMRLGAINYLTKPADAEAILQAFAPESTAVETPDSSPSLKRLEWEHIQRVLNDNDGNISATARQLGLHRRTLQRKLDKRPVRQ